MLSCQDAALRGCSATPTGTAPLHLITSWGQTWLLGAICLGCFEGARAGWGAGQKWSEQRAKPWCCPAWQPQSSFACVGGYWEKQGWNQSTLQGWEPGASHWSNSNCFSLSSSTASFLCCSSLQSFGITLLYTGHIGTSLTPECIMSNRTTTISAQQPGNLQFPHLLNLLASPGSGWSRHSSCDSCLASSLHWLIVAKTNEADNCWPPAVVAPAGVIWVSVLSLRPTFCISTEGSLLLLSLADAVQGRDRVNNPLNLDFCLHQLQMRLPHNTTGSTSSSLLFLRWWSRCWAQHAKSSTPRSQSLPAAAAKPQGMGWLYHRFGFMLCNVLSSREVGMRSTLLQGSGWQLPGSI